MKLNTIDDVTQLILTLFFLGCFFYVLYFYTGNERGLIRPEIIYSYLTGIISGKLIETFFKKR